MTTWQDIKNILREYDKQDREGDKWAQALWDKAMEVSPNNDGAKKEEV